MTSTGVEENLASRTCNCRLQKGAYGVKGGGREEEVRDFEQDADIAPTKALVTTGDHPTSTSPKKTPLSRAEAWCGPHLLCNVRVSISFGHVMAKVGSSGQLCSHLGQRLQFVAKQEDCYEIYRMESQGLECGTGGCP